MTSKASSSEIKQARGLEAATSEATSTWRKLMETYVGILPLPVYVVLTAVVAVTVLSGPIPTEMAMVLAIMMVGSFTLAEIGNRLPGLSTIGAAALLITFIPSALVYYGVLPAPITKVVAVFFASTNILFMFIAMVIVGSILGMDRGVLIKGFVKIFLPLIAGSVVASVVGTAAGV